MAPWIEYAIVISEEKIISITFWRIPFDVDELARIIRASGKPFSEQAIAM